MSNNIDEKRERTKSNKGSMVNNDNMSYTIFPSEIRSGLHKDNILAGNDIANSPANEMLAEKWDRQKQVVDSEGGGVLTQRLRDGELNTTIYYSNAKAGEPNENNPFISDDTFVDYTADSVNKHIIGNRQKQDNLSRVERARLMVKLREAYANLVRTHLEWERKPQDARRIHERDQAELLYHRLFNQVPSNLELPAIPPPSSSTSTAEIGIGTETEIQSGTETETYPQVNPTVPGTSASARRRRRRAEAAAATATSSGRGIGISRSKSCRNIPLVRSEGSSYLL